MMHEELKLAGEQPTSEAETALIGKPYKGRVNASLSDALNVMQLDMYAAFVLLIKIYLNYNSRTHIERRQLPRMKPHTIQTMTKKTFLEHLLHQ